MRKREKITRMTRYRVNLGVKLHIWGYLSGAVFWGSVFRLSLLTFGQLGEFWAKSGGATQAVVLLNPYI